MVWQEEPADSWEETLEVKDSWEMEEETAKVKKKYKTAHFWQYCGSALISTCFWIRIQLFISWRIWIRNQLFTALRIWIHEAKPMRIHVDQDPDPGQTWSF
jgi:hypothetical protein